MAESSDSGSPNPPGGLNEAVLADRDKEDLGGAGGSSGGGTIAGRGEPSGGTLDGTGGTSAGVPGDIAGGGAHGSGREQVAEVSDDQVAGEAAALGGADGSLADAAGRQTGSSLPGAGAVDSEALRGAGRAEPGSGTPADHGELGGGGPLGQHGGTGSAGTDRR